MKEQPCCHACPYIPSAKRPQTHPRTGSWGGGGRCVLLVLDADGKMHSEPKLALINLLTDKTCSINYLAQNPNAKSHRADLDNSHIVFSRRTLKRDCLQSQTFWKHEKLCISNTRPYATRGIYMYKNLPRLAEKLV